MLDSPSDGEYVLNNQPVAKLSLSDRTRIRNTGDRLYLFRPSALIGDLSIYENVELPLTYRGMAAGERAPPF